jgi:hypothetical protein
MQRDNLWSGYHIMSRIGLHSCTSHPGPGHTPRYGFTLFEVSISLVLVAFGVVSVLMLFPSGLKAQQMARFQIYAAAKAEEMIEQFNGTQHSNPAIDSEGVAMWDVPVAHKAQSWDLESRLSAHRFGIMPLPLDVARRLDSDGDEIQQILDQGGYVYFSQPLASTGTQEQGAASAPPNEAQKLIIGVKGYAQQNCLSSFPLKNWPYHTPMPSPPLQMHHMPDKWLPQRVVLASQSPTAFTPSTNYYTKYYSYYSWPWTDLEDQKYGVNAGQRNWSETFCVPWETSPAVPSPGTGHPGFIADPDIQKVYDWPDDEATVEVKPNLPVNSGPQRQPLHVGYFPYACGRLWEASAYNYQQWQEYVTPATVPPIRFPYKVGNIVMRNGATYYCILDHDARQTADTTVTPNIPANAPPNATFWRNMLNTNRSATHLEQITASSTGNSGQAVYGEYPSRPSVGRYVAATLWYAESPEKKFMWSDLSTVGNPYAPFTRADSREHWKEVQVFRFLAHATACLTAWYSYGGSEPENLSAGVTIPVVKLAGRSSPANVKITHDLIKYYHERSLFLINLFASSYPNDWAMPRPLNRVSMMDYPLLQFDLFTPALPAGLLPNPLYNASSGAASANSNYARIFGRNEVDNPHQYRVLSPEPIRNIGVSATYPTNAINSTMRLNGHEPTSHFGDISHFTLTAPFEAAERCRELVFWVADWQSYEDFETAPSAPVDASKYPVGAPRGDWHASGHTVPTPHTRSWNDRMIDMEFRDEQLWSYRNPEKTLMFFKLANPDGAYKRNPDFPNLIGGNINVDVRTLPTGFNVESNMVLNRPWNSYPDRGSNQENRMNFVGLWGADRNFNKTLDRGPLPKSVRMRAVQVARFSFYDPRVQAMLR